MINGGEVGSRLPAGLLNCTFTVTGTSLTAGLNSTVQVKVTVDPMKTTPAVVLLEILTVGVGTTMKQAVNSCCKFTK